MQSDQESKVSLGASSVLCILWIALLKHSFLEAGPDVRDEHEKQIRSPNRKGGA